jgi:DNA-binding NarL/FixJ family response regulator
MYGESQFATALAQQGAAGFVCKDAADRELTEAVRAVAQGRTHFSHQVLQVLDRDEALPHETLTPRELQVFMLLLEGRQTGAIAAELGLGASTVSSHIGKVKEKLGVESVADIVHYAYRHGLLG